MECERGVGLGGGGGTAVGSERCSRKICRRTGQTFLLEDSIASSGAGQNTSSRRFYCSLPSMREQTEPGPFRVYDVLLAIQIILGFYEDTCAMRGYKIECSLLVLLGTPVEQR